MSPDTENPSSQPAGDSSSKQENPETKTSASAPRGTPPQFQTFQGGLEETLDKKKMDFLYDIELEVSVELGRAELKVRDVLSLKSGSVVELDRLAGDPVDIRVNNKLIARGEVIVIDENFAVRITDILNSAEIVSTLGNGY